MPLNEVINKTRISIINLGYKQRGIDEALATISKHIESKYNQGFYGACRRIASIFFNLFVSFWQENKKDKRYSLPFLIGSNVGFIQLTRKIEEASCAL